MFLSLKSELSFRSTDEFITCRSGMCFIFTLGSWFFANFVCSCIKFGNYWFMRSLT